MNPGISAAAPGEGNVSLVDFLQGRFYFALHGAYRLSAVAFVLPLPAAKISAVIRKGKKNISHD